MRAGLYIHFIESVYPTLILDALESGSFKITVRNETTIDAYGYVSILLVGAYCHASIRGITYGVRLLRCSFYCDGHMPEPRGVERATDTDSSRFSIF